jgi:ADP-L-glycero-D-manno-heptose 6-epimerase
LNHAIGGLFNLGTGQARSWNDLVQAVFQALDRPPAIEYIDMPQALRGRYQYFTQADMEKLRAAGCPVQFHSLEDAVRDYVVKYLNVEQRHLSTGE